MEALEMVRRTRRTHGGTTAKLLNKIKGLMKQKDLDVNQLKQYSIDHSEKQKTIKEIDATIVDLMIENESKVEYCDKGQKKPVKLESKLNTALRQSLMY